MEYNPGLFSGENYGQLPPSFNKNNRILNRESASIKIDTVTPDMATAKIERLAKGLL
jgi:hypothetical protein